MTAVYMRVGNTWMRRARMTDSASVWLNAARVPRPVRSIGERTPSGGTLVVEFDTASKTAKERPA